MKVMIWMYSIWILIILIISLLAIENSGKEEFLRACSKVKSNYECIVEWRKL